MSTDSADHAAGTTEENHGLMDKIAGAVEQMVNKNDDDAPTIEPIEQDEPVVPASETPAGHGMPTSAHMDETGKIGGA